MKGAGVNPQKDSAQTSQNDASNQYLTHNQTQ